MSVYVTIYVLICAIVSVFYIRNVDWILRYLHDHHLETWIAYGKPSGFMFRPIDSSFFASTNFYNGLLFGKINFDWLLDDPLAGRKIKQFLKLVTALRALMYLVLPLTVIMYVITF